jgi:hypothetical protein
MKLIHLSALAAGLVFLPISAFSADYPVGPATGDLTGQYGTPGLQVGGVLGHPLPALSAGYPHWNGTNWVFDVPGGGFAAGGDLTGSASSQQVVSITGSAGLVLMVSTAANLQWSQGTTSPTISQARQANGAAPQNILIFPAAPGAGASTTANGTPGSLQLELSAPVSTGVESGFSVYRGGLASGNFIGQIGALPGASNFSTLWLCNGQAPTGSNYTIAVSSSAQTAFNACGASLDLAVGNSTRVALTASLFSVIPAVQFSAYGTGIGHFDSAGNLTSSQINLASSADVGGMLGVGSGGTNRSSLSAHAVVLGNGTGTVGLASPSTAGFYFRDNGAGADPTFQAGAAWHTTTFCAVGCTSTSGSTYTPATSLLIVKGCAAGGAGAGACAGTNQGSNGAGGGGAGAWIDRSIPVTPSAAITVFVGTAATGQAACTGGPATGGGANLLSAAGVTLMTMPGASGGTGNDSTFSSSDPYAQLFVPLGGAPTTSRGSSYGGFATGPTFPTAPGSGGEGMATGSFSPAGLVTSAQGLDALVCLNAAVSCNGGTAGAHGAAGAGSFGLGGGGGGASAMGSGGAGGAGGDGTSATVGGAGHAGGNATGYCAGGAGAGGGSGVSSGTPGAGAAGGNSTPGYLEISEYF